MSVPDRDDHVRAGPVVRTASPGQLDVSTLYAILQLRAAVFVVEQRIAYQDLDDRDLDANTRHCWIDDRGRVVSYLRILREPDEWRIGRVVTAPSDRGRGHAATLIRHALELIGPHTAMLHAQSHLVGWYQRLGFVVEGEEFLEEGLPHRLMRHKPGR